MEIKLKNNMVYSENYIRVYHELPIELLKPSLSSLKMQIKESNNKASMAMCISSINVEIEIRQHPNYIQYHKAWLVVYNKRVSKWEKEKEERNKSIDNQIKKLQEQKLI